MYVHQITLILMAPSFYYDNYLPKWYTNWSSIKIILSDLLIMHFLPEYFGVF